MYQETRMILLCQHTSQVYILQYSGLQGWLALSTNTMCFASLDFIKSFFLLTVVVLGFRVGQVISVASNLVSLETVPL